MNRIVAVAIAQRNGKLRIKTSADLRDLKRVRVRPYLRGLVQGLDVRGHHLGKDYDIEFRQRKAADIDRPTFDNYQSGDPLVIFCMSTTVVAKAKDLVGSPTPIVGIVSEPTLEQFDTVTNICGVSAKRSQTAGECFGRFLRTVPTLTEVRVLHKPGYGPSDRALSKVRTAAAAMSPPVTVTPVPITTAADIEDAIDAMHARDVDNPATVGIQVLPVDVCLGHAQDIIDLAQGEKKLPTFFPVPDWVKPDEASAIGAYGVPQRRCGQLMAERVDAIWKNGGTVPGAGFARWTEAPADAFEFVASTAAAHELNIKLHTSIPRV